MDLFYRVIADRNEAGSVRMLRVIRVQWYEDADYQDRLFTDEKFESEAEAKKFIVDTIHQALSLMPLLSKYMGE